MTCICQLSPSPAAAACAPPAHPHTHVASELTHCSSIHGCPPPCPLQVREAQLAQYNYILVIGAEEVAARTVNVRTRDNVVHGAFGLDDFARKLDDENRSRGSVSSPTTRL